MFLLVHSMARDSSHGLFRVPRIRKNSVQLDIKTIRKKWWSCAIIDQRYQTVVDRINNFFPGCFGASEENEAQRRSDPRSTTSIAQTFNTQGDCVNFGK
jgi:hypothetical protein